MADLAETIFKEEINKIAESVAKEKANQQPPQNPPVNTDTPPSNSAPPASADTPPVNTELKKDEAAGINDESAIQYLKSKGIDTSSLEDLKTKLAPAKTEKTEEQSLTEALEYGVKNGKIKLEEYNKAVQYKSSPAKELVFQNFSEKLKERNPKITDEEIQSRFNKKYAASESIEEIKDELGEVTDRKIVYALDDKEIEADAEEIRKQAWSPIETVKKSHSAYQEEQNFVGTVLKEIEGIKTQIPKTVKIPIGDNETFDYEIDASFEKQITETLLNNYANARVYAHKNGIKWDESFNLNDAVQNVVWSIAGKNIMQIYGKNRYDEGLLKGVEDFKNPTKKPLETLNKEGNKSLPPETEAEIAARSGRQDQWRTR